MNFSVGIGDAIARIAEIRGRATKDALGEIAGAGADVFHAEAQQLAPVLDGDLREGIQKQEPRAIGPLLVVVDVVSTAPHGARIEFGYRGPDSLGRHFHEGPHSYMRASYDGKKEEARAAMIDKGREVILGA